MIFIVTGSVQVGRLPAAEGCAKRKNLEIFQQIKPRSLFNYAVINSQDQSIVVQSGCGAGMIVFTRKIKPKIVSGCDPS
jgi:hypothetical protein